MVVFDDLFFNLRVGDFGGALMEQAGARHDDGVLGIYLDEFADEGRASHERSGHLGIIVSHGSGSLKEKLELALGGVGVVVEDFSESFFASLFHGKFYGLNAAEGISNQLGVVFFEESLDIFGINGVFWRSI